MQTKEAQLLDDALLLVEQNFYFLSAGQFFGKLAKTTTFDESQMDVSMTFDAINTYRFNPTLTKVVLADAYGMSTSNEVSLFEYFVAFNAFRGMCMAMVEGLRLESGFRFFLEKRLGERFEDFFDILSFVRNVLSHNIHAEIILNAKDYEGTLKRIRRMHRNPLIEFYFIYAEDLPEVEAPYPSYGFTCKVDFEALHEEMTFLEVIPLWELLMLCELSFNLVQAYRMTTVPIVEVE